MIQYGHCPQCQSPIDKKRLEQGLLVCSLCAWVDDTREQRFRERIENSIIKLMIGTSVFVVATFILSANSGTAGSQIAWMKFKQTLHVDTMADYAEMIDVCKRNQNSECLEAGYQGLVRKDPNNLETLAEYGRLLETFQKHDKALPILSRYFSTGGRDIKTAYSFAKVLAANGKYESAERYYQFVINSEPNIIQITVMRSYVDMLIKTQRYVEAKNLIQKFKADQQDLMLANQYKEIQKFLASR